MTLIIFRAADAGVEGFGGSDQTSALGCVWPTVVRLFDVVSIAMIHQSVGGMQTERSSEPLEPVLGKTLLGLANERLPHLANNPDPWPGTSRSFQRLTPRHCRTVA
jgi:hypothetical protein